MSESTPREVLELLDADGPSSTRRAWEKFVRIHSALLLEATRTLDGDYDDAMNRYAFVLEKLQDDGFRRLRAYRADGRAKFTTWLVVVAKRLCIDLHRSQYGRNPGAKSNPESEEGPALMRRRLVDLIGHGEVEELEDHDVLDAENRLIREELLAALDQELRALDHRDRLLLVLRYEDDATAREIRRIMDFPSLGHVYRRLDKILGDLRDRLRARGLGGT